MQRTERLEAALRGSADTHAATVAQLEERLADAQRKLDQGFTAERESLVARIEAITAREAAAKAHFEDKAGAAAARWASSRFFRFDLFSPRALPTRPLSFSCVSLSPRKSPAVSFTRSKSSQP